jgi:hypothetical protein
MASNLQPYTGVALVNTQTNAGTITLPLTSDIPTRQITIKDSYGNLPNKTVTVNTQGGDTFEDGTTTKVLNLAQGFQTFYAYSGKWYTLGGTFLNAVSISTLTVSTLSGVSLSSSNVPGLVSTVNTVGGIAFNNLSTVQISAATITVSTVQAAVLSSFRLNTSSLFASNASLSSLQVNSLQIGTGTGWVNLGPLQTVALSSIQTNTGFLLASSIGINTSTPRQYLEVTGISSAIRISDYTSARNPGLELVRGIPTFGADIFTDWRIHNEGGNLKFYRKDSFTPSDGDAMVITDLARVGINCNAPGVALDVAGTARSFSTVTSSVTLGTGAGWVTTGALQAVALSSVQLNTALGFVSTLYVGSTTTQLQGYTARINGLALVSSMIIGQPAALVSTSGAALLSLTRDAASKPGTTTWGIPSDVRIKENIVNADLDRCYSDIKSVPLRRFSYKPWFFNAVQGKDKHVLGFIAQEVSTIIPKVVTIDTAYGFSDFNILNIDQLNMSLYGAVKKLISEKEFLESTVKGQHIEFTTLQGTTHGILSTLEGLQGR